MRYRKQHLHRVFFDYGRKDARVWPDQIAGRDRRPPDASGDRRFDVGIGQLDLRVAKVRLGFHNRGLGLTLFGGPLIELRNRGIALAGQLGGARELLIGIGERRLGGG